MINSLRFNELPREITKESISLDFVRSSGPGGQHVNKVSTAVLLRLNVRKTLFSSNIKSRLLHLSGSKATNSGEIIIKANRYRSQTRNREEAIDRLNQLVVGAKSTPTPRLKTSLKASKKKQRVDQKKRRGKIKRNRGRPSYD
tara:strand:+ start:485 stop:913 length:429 start_codon:yes stop_codon:yes gene_type:complete